MKRHDETSTDSEDSLATNLHHLSITPSSELPQPHSPELPYTYLRYEDVVSHYFDKQSPLAADTLVWVLTSKGPNKPPDLFNRARVVGDAEEGGRIVVRYPKGSTYRVRRCNLIPVLEAGVTTTDRIVLVTPETPSYRKLCVVHTNVHETFLEIGCDFGPCVDRVRRALTEVAVPKRSTDAEKEKETDVVVDASTNTTNHTPESTPIPPAETTTQRISCLGIDKSPTSLEIARKKYPQTYFSLEDAITEDGVQQLRTLCRDTLVHSDSNGRNASLGPNVVAVDINGNRELPAVLACLTQIIRPKKDTVHLGVDWELPRLIIVKSRSLYQAMGGGDEIPNHKSRGCQ
mmetsp:Transcript_60026/g.72136  ORF Transcript_60026/g.72136 Transcript_60026/m.72136 type:complete len:346 (-) Transcript_60026:495-1532(-)